jgi:hypothetical protein
MGCFGRQRGEAAAALQRCSISCRAAASAAAGGSVALCRCLRLHGSTPLRPRASPLPTLAARLRLILHLRSGCKARCAASALLRPCTLDALPHRDALMANWRCGRSCRLWVLCRCLLLSERDCERQNKACCGCAVRAGMRARETSVAARREHPAAAAKKSEGAAARNASACAKNCLHTIRQRQRAAALRSSLSAPPALTAEVNQVQPRSSWHPSCYARTQVGEKNCSCSMAAAHPAAAAAVTAHEPDAGATNAMSASLVALVRPQPRSSEGAA